MTPETVARLERLDIHLAAEAKEFRMFVRGRSVALVGGSGAIGSSGVLTENGLAYLIWREGRPMLAAHGGRECEATPQQVEAIRSFSKDLEKGLAAEEPS